MNKKQPFEEAFERQMSNLSTPHEDESWQNMKQLLDDNEKRRPFYKTFEIAIILILMLLIGFWLIIKETSTTKEKPVTIVKNDKILQQKEQVRTADQLPDLLKNSHSGHSLKTQNTSQKHSDRQVYTNSQGDESKRQKSASIQHKKVEKPITKTIFKKNKINQNHTIFRNHNNVATTDIAGTKSKVISLHNDFAKVNKSPANFQKPHEFNSLADIQTMHSNPLMFQFHDTSARKEESLIKVFAAAEKFSINNKKYFLSAGIGLQQQVPLAGQKVVTYGYNAKNPLSDYIPSVYLRLEKDRKWFVQAEFVYTAPQLIKEFSYSRKTITSDSNGTVTTTALNLRKAFFNKIPLTFNYYIRPNWSVGAGSVYSVFEGAIAEKEITSKSTQTNTQSVTKQIVPITGYTDSFLYKSHVHLLAQTNYNRGRFSAGLRYTKDIQPYIRYTLPNGTITNKKNYALEFIVRFRLWKSAKF